ncbi:MAG: GTPase Era [Proteobacteria bacterium]|nr:GTPase Era [Pseudomonadota bacterium]
MTNKNYRSGFVSLVGEPNVGKSTLLNSLLGQEISITADKPQTTRNQIRGIISKPTYQAVVIDTPGIHDPKNELHRRSVEWAKHSMGDGDIIFWLIKPYQNSKSGLSRNDQLVLEALNQVDRKIVLLINKIDCFPKEVVNRTLIASQDIKVFEKIIPISAKKGTGLQHIEKILSEKLPIGIAYYPDGQVTDLSERTLMAELIREQIMRKCFHEIPYGTAVVIEGFRDLGSKLEINATIFVEKSSHKGIIIGKNGAMLKQIGMGARKKLEKILSVSVKLQTHIKVSNNWFNKPNKLTEFGYDPSS